MRIILAGIGMGAREQMTQAVQEACMNADIIFGAAKVLETVEWCATPKEAIYEAEKIYAYLQEHLQYCSPVVIFSGDTGFYSGASQFVRLYGANDQVELQILPGITTVQAMAARLGTNWQDVELCSIHGRSRNIMNELRRHARVFCLASGAEDVRRISQQLIDYGYQDAQVSVAVNMTCQDEWIGQGSPQEFLQFERTGLCAFMIEKSQDSSSQVYGLPDDFFIRGRVPMTKEEVRAVSVAKLHLNPDAIVYDIGAGTGSVSIECAIHLTKGEVYAIERKEEAASLIEQNAHKASADHVHVIRGIAPDVLQGLPKPTHVFVGGSSGRLEEILNQVREANPHVRIVVNAITLETQSELLQYVRKHEITDADIITMQVSRSETVAGYHMMRGENPIMIGSF